MTFFLMTLIHLIPLAMTTTIFLLMICLTILLHAPRRGVMMLLTVWLGWKLKSNAVAS